MPTDGKRLVIDAGLAISLVGVVVSSLVVWFFAGLTFFGDPLHRDDYQAMVLGFAMGAALLVLVVPALRYLRASPTIVVMALLLAALCGVAALAASSSLAGATPDEYPETWWYGAELFLFSPTGWPVLALVLTTPWIRARSRRAPR